MPDSILLLTDLIFFSESLIKENLTSACNNASVPVSPPVKLNGSISAHLVVGKRPVGSKLKKKDLAFPALTVFYLYHFKIKQTSKKQLKRN